MAAPVEGLKLKSSTAGVKRVDELVHAYETTGSGRLRDELRGATYYERALSAAPTSR